MNPVSNSFGLGRPVRVGIAGMGKMGLLHAAVLSRIPGARLVGVSDRDRRLVPYLRSVGIKAPFYHDIVSMLDREGLDALYVCTPTGSHLPVARAALAQAPHVAIYVEKPLAESLPSALEFLSIAQSAKILTAVGYILVAKPVYRALKKILEGGGIGRVMHVEASVMLSEVSHRRSGWRYDRRQAGGGVVIEIASHLLALVEWFLGLPSRVSAHMLPEGEWSEEEATLLLSYPDGCGVSIVCSRSRPGYPLLSIEMLFQGERGKLRATDEELFLSDESDTWTPVDRRTFPLRPAFDLGGEAFYIHDLEFLEQVADPGAGFSMPWARGAAVQAIIAAAYSSSAASGIEQVVHQVGEPLGVPVDAAGGVP